MHYTTKCPVFLFFFVQPIMTCHDHLARSPRCASIRYTYLSSFFHSLVFPLPTPFSYSVILSIHSFSTRRGNGGSVPPTLCLLCSAIMFEIVVRTRCARLCCFLYLC